MHYVLGLIPLQPFFCLPISCKLCVDREVCLDKHNLGKMS